jgi:tetratricopeptide (TPR) repeat protein
VLDHNRHDIVSLAAVTAHALRLGAEGPDGCEMSTEQLGLGRLYERAGDTLRAEQAYALAAAAEDSEIAAQALARLAVLLRRSGRYDEAARAWQGVLELNGSAEALERQAIEALSIHNEHRARVLAGARQYAETLRRQASGLQAREVDRRLNRLERKIKKADEAARLLG